MEMNKETYEKLLRRFSQELFDVGVTDNMVELVKDKVTRMPNVAYAISEETAASFAYKHDGFEISAKQVIHLTVRKAK